MSDTRQQQARKSATAKAEPAHVDESGPRTQLKRQASALSYDDQLQLLRPGGPIHTRLDTPVQAAGGTAGDTRTVHEAASSGLTGSAESLPFLGAIQHSFGSHDVSGVKAHLGSSAQKANKSMGSTAYAMGGQVAFGKVPDLHTAAHEAAHVVQQRAGVDLPGGVGRVGDAYEKHADAVADHVVQGKSAESLLGQMTGGAEQGVQQKAVQQAGTGTTLDLKTEARKDVVASQKYTDVDTDPNCASLKVPFFKEAEKRLNADSSAAANGGPAALKAMRAEVKAKQTTYLLKGPAMPSSKLIASNGITRILDLPSLYNHGYLKPTVKALHADADAFVTAAKGGRFDPDKDLDNRKNLQGKVKETWWAETGPTAGLNLAQMITAFHLVGDTKYEKGAVRLTITAADVATFGLTVCKPTAFDGLQQGWGTDPWWVSSSDPHWGLTKHGTKEVVMGAARLRCFSKRDLVLP